MWWRSPSTFEEARSATVLPQTMPETLPRTNTWRTATMPVTWPFSPTITSAACTSPSISPSTCKTPRPMIFSPWPMILRSLPITDFSLVSVPAALKAPLPPLATDVASCFGRPSLAGLGDRRNQSPQDLNLRCGTISFRGFPHSLSMLPLPRSAGDSSGTVIAVPDARRAGAHHHRRAP